MVEEKNNPTDPRQVLVAKLGVKGAFLDDMFKAKVLVPPGFIITTAFQEFMEKTRIFSRIETLMKANYASIDDMNSIVQTSNEAMVLIKEAIFPEDMKESILEEFDKLKAEYVAVRSSLLFNDSSSFVLNREFVSHLNINRAGLLEAIKNVFISFFCPAAIAYHLQHNIDIKKPLAVLLIQKMVDAEVSGVCFTWHPLTRDTNQIVIEASLGLGQELNTQKIARDTYVINKNEGRILGRTVIPQEKMLARVESTTKEVKVADLIQSKQKLSDLQMVTLAKLAKYIDDYYKNVPQKIEWVLEKNKFYILQSEAIVQA